MSNWDCNPHTGGVLIVYEIGRGLSCTPREFNSLSLKIDSPLVLMFQLWFKGHTEPHGVFDFLDV